MHVPELFFTFSEPIYTPSIAETDIEPAVSLVLPLYLNDLSRASVLLYSLRSLGTDTIDKLYVFVPDEQVDIIHFSLYGLMQQLSFPCSVYPESILFERNYEMLKAVYPYAIQMAI
jgi:hypothetical protein